MDTKFCGRVKAYCRHCGRGMLWLHRGLCFRCWHDPEISAGYPSSSKYANDVGIGKFYGLGKPTTPTTALPGTPRKVEVLERRAANGERLWHPDDPTLRDVPL